MHLYTQNQEKHIKNTQDALSVSRAPLFKRCALRVKAASELKSEEIFMTIFNVFSLLGGLALFLFGMDLMGQALERRAGGRLKSLLGRLTT